MENIILLIVIALIVGFVTAGLKIQFDRFFAIILLVSLLKLPVTDAVNIFLWIMFLSAIAVLWKNREKIKNIPIANKKKFSTLVPLLVFIGVLLGTSVLNYTPDQSLKIILGILALLYGLRLIFLHFKPHESEYKNEKPIYQKMCGLLGPILSGFSTGFIGTTLKPLKLPFAVKIGRMNLGQVYLGNTITALYASIFAITMRIFYIKQSSMTIHDAIFGFSLWIGIHFVYEITNLFFKDKWRKPFQIIIGIILIVVAFKFF